MILGDEDYQMIERYLDCQQGSSLEGTFDLAFVFGTKSQIPIPLIAELLGRRRVERVLLTGGMNRSTKLVEATTHQEELLKMGISKDRIITETRSKNTLENVSFGLDKLWSLFRYHEINRVLAVTKWYHSRRALMTLKAQLPKHIELVNLSYEPDNCTRTNWMESAESEQLVLKEWTTIPKYLEFGHLAEL